MRSRLGILLVLLLGLLLPLGCGGSPETRPKADPEPTLIAVPQDLQVEPDRPATDPRQALALIPADATEVTITDWREMRDRLGYPRLTSDSLMTDRIAFWERARREGLALAEGLLRPEASRLWLDYDLSQDDVQWEARFRTPAGSGFVLLFRRDLDMARVRRAVTDPATKLRGEVLAQQHLLVDGVADEGDPVLASVPGILDLYEPDVESSYLRTSCVPTDEALGDDATVEDLDALLAKQDIRFLRPLEAFTVSFSGPVATARLGAGRTDLHDRVALIDLWPQLGPVTWADAFQGMPVGDSTDGRVGLQVRNPAAAVGLVLAGRLPFAVCNEVVPMAVPTGL
ncbi:hypothetical protein [Nocardioides daejeonensis]|uniref:hypothetical protein n=1 Tax=Nocardioides daejeonensis TaxID=1046556 RepID=UPI000D74D5FA|nr:hypothetical protein [Nocardioides daejeonensis]